jgi:hypothetical protein
MKPRGALLGAVGMVFAVVLGAAAAERPRGSLGAPESSPSHPGLMVPPKSQETPAGKSHRPGELECGNCHQSKHQGVVRMYLGMGGRGTPMIPSHMFQVRVECVACHVAPKESEAAAGMVGQTFRPSEQACFGCHGEKYRGMLERWSSTLARMREILTPKLAAARTALLAADGKNPKHTWARSLADDAEFNIEFVALGKGIHNVFYAADLLKLSDGWLDQSLAMLGKPPARTDDALVRGGYCAVLCHEQAGVKQPATVTFGKQKLPHVRHVTEFGAVCTACHSAEVHKAVTAKTETCMGCHHDPQNERCENCHRAQSAFFRGSVKSPLAKAEPDVMANAVGCVGCHDLSKRLRPRETVAEKCVGCHDKAYSSFLTEWTVGLDKEMARAGDTLRRAETWLARERRNGKKSGDAEALVKEARDALALVRKARGVHNPTLAQTLLDSAREKAAKALAANGRH